jgi:hypothetical protein
MRGAVDIAAEDILPLLHLLHSLPNQQEEEEEEAHRLSWVIAAPFSQAI